MEIKLVKLQYLLASIMVIFLISCSGNNSDSNVIKEKEELVMYNTLFKEANVNKKMQLLFDLNDTASPKAFKVIVAKHINFVRITVFQIFGKYEIKQLPAGTFNYKRNLFLYYNGSESLFKNFVAKHELDRRLAIKNIVLVDSLEYIQDTRVLQFEIRDDGKTIINDDAINAFDERDSPDIRFK